MNAYEERRERKLERAKELASRYAKQSIQAHERSNKLAEMIPFGQPILVGHHSEGAHRNHIKKIHSAMNKSIELSDKSEYYRNKIENIENNNMISSDDPEAITKLKEKLELLYKERETIKAREHAHYELPNLSGRIKQVKDRIEYLEKMQKLPEIPDIIIGDITIRVNKEINRVQIIYPGKPSEETRTKLKSNGFRWSPYEKAWQRQYGRWTYDIAKEIAGVTQ
jgi:hypothetical protein